VGVWAVEQESCSKIIKTVEEKFQWFKARKGYAERAEKDLFGGSAKKAKAKAKSSA